MATDRRKNNTIKETAKIAVKGEIIAKIMGLSGCCGAGVTGKNPTLFDK